MTRPALNVSALRAPDAVLTIDGRDYLIRGALPVEVIAEFVAINEEIVATEDSARLITLVRDAGRLLEGLIAEKNEDVPEFHFELTEVLGIIAYLIGADVGQSFMEKVTADMTEGQPPKTEEELAAQVAAIERGEVDDLTPLASESSSESSSTDSESSTDGGLNGGVESLGDASAFTALPLTAE